MSSFHVKFVQTDRGTDRQTICPLSFNADASKSENEWGFWGSFEGRILQFWKKSSPQVRYYLYTIPVFFNKMSLIILEFSHLICLNHKTPPINHPKRRKSAKNQKNIILDPISTFDPTLGEAWPLLARSRC